MGIRTTRILATGSAIVVTGAGALIATAGPASADVPDKWEKRTNICQTLSFYSENPAYNDNLTPSHQVSGHKRFYWTSGPIEKGWTPVYSAGQSDWHTGWVRGECLAAGWDYPDDGHVDY